MTDTELDQMSIIANAVEAIANQHNKNFRPVGETLGSDPPGLQHLKLLARIANAVEEIAKGHNQRFQHYTPDMNNPQHLELLKRISHAVTTVAEKKLPFRGPRQIRLNTSSGL